MRRNLTLAVAVAILMVTAGCLGAVPSESVTAPAAGGAPLSAAADQATISVSATGQVSTDADLAVVSIAVERSDDTADGAREAVARDVAAMREALRGAGVTDDQVRTVSFSIFPEYDYSERTPRLTGYQAVHAFAVEVSPGEAGTVIDAGVGAGATRVTGVAFTLTDETSRELRSEALGLAVADARADADTVAEAAGVSITGVQSIATGGGGVSPVRESLEAGGGGGRTPTVLEPGPVTVTASVSVTYTIGSGSTA